MIFLRVLQTILFSFGSGGTLLVAVVVFLVGLGVYKFVKDWLPW